MPDTQISEPLTQVERLRLAIALTESYDDRVFEIEPECVEALLKEYDELRDKYNKITAALSGHVVVPREPTVVQMDAAGSTIAEYVRKMKAAGGGVDAMDYALRVVIYRAMIQAAPPVQEIEG